MAIPNSTVATLVLIASLALSGHDEDARENLRQYLALPGNIPKTIAQFEARNPYVGLPALRDRLASRYEGLRKAGMPGGNERAHRLAATLAVKKFLNVRSLVRFGSIASV